MYGGARAIYSRGCCGAGSRARHLYECIYFYTVPAYVRVSKVLLARVCITAIQYTEY